MILYTVCPYCANNVRMEVDSVISSRELEIYQEWKCNHCPKSFIYKLEIKATAYKLPTYEGK